MSLSFNFDEWQHFGDAKQAVFRSQRDGEYLRPIAVRSPDPQLLVNPDRAVAWDQAFLRWAVRRVVAALETEEFDIQTATIEYFVIEPTDDEIAMIDAMIGTKSCDYQVAIDRDLFCSAAAPSDPTVVSVGSSSRLAPTSKPLCFVCEVPSAEVICSHLHHPQVSGHRVGTTWSRYLEIALCDRNKPGIASPSECLASGHGCWERVVEHTSLSKDSAAPSPLDLLEAFDYLDAVWRSHLNRPRLVRTLSAARVAALSQGCKSKNDFLQRIDGLADLINNMQIDISSLPEDPGPGTINRLQATLRGVASGELQLHLQNALSTLRTVVLMRDGFTHSGASNQLPSAFQRFALAYPPRSWEHAWNTVQLRTIEALRSIRAAISNLSE